MKVFQNALQHRPQELRSERRIFLFFLSVCHFWLNCWERQWSLVLMLQKQWDDVYRWKQATFPSALEWMLIGNADLWKCAHTAVSLLWSVFEMVLVLFPLLKLTSLAMAPLIYIYIYIYTQLNANSLLFRSDFSKLVVEMWPCPPPTNLHYFR